jgi:hypothetical protein
LTVPAFFLAIVRFRCGIAVPVHTVIPVNLPALSRIAHAAFSSACLLTSVVPRSTIGGVTRTFVWPDATHLPRGARCVGLLKIPVARGTMVCGGPPIGEMCSRNHVQEHAPAPLAFPIAPCTNFSMKDESRISAGARTPLHNIAPRAAAFPCAALRALCRHAVPFIPQRSPSFVNIYVWPQTTAGQGQSTVLDLLRIIWDTFRNSHSTIILQIQKFPSLQRSDPSF